MSDCFRKILGAILVVAAAVRLFRLDHFSYGLDEVLQAYWIHGPWDFFWRSLRFDAFHPPLDYIVGKLLEGLHPSDAVRKIPAAVWGVGGVAAFGVLLARRSGEAAGLVAAALLALAPFHVRFSQELRPYSLSLFLLCLSLLLLDRFLERPSTFRLAALFVSCLATAYTLYLAAAVLAVTAAALLAEDALGAAEPRRGTARRFLAWSPGFLLALFVAYLPWWPVFLEAARRPPLAARPPLSLARADRILSFFAFAPEDGYRLGGGGTLFLALAALGMGIACRRRGARFLVAWSVGGLAAIELLGQLHPHFDVSRRFLPSGPALVALAALPLAALLEQPTGPRLAGALGLAAVLGLDLRGLVVYFDHGRSDWRPLADFLRREAAPSERVFTENQYSQLCVAFYLVGPQWLYEASHGGRPSRSVVSLDGEIVRLTWAWTPGQVAWLVLAGQPVHDELRKWAAGFPSFSFPRAEGSVVHRLDPSRRESALGLTR